MFDYGNKGLIRRVLSLSISILRSLRSVYAPSFGKNILGGVSRKHYKKSNITSILISVVIGGFFIEHKYPILRKHSIRFVVN